MLTEHVDLEKHIAGTQQVEPMNERQLLNGFYVSSKTQFEYCGGRWEKRSYREGDVMYLTVFFFFFLPPRQDKISLEQIKHYTEQTASLTTYVDTPVLTLWIEKPRIRYGGSSNCKHFRFSPYLILNTQFK